MKTLFNIIKKWFLTLTGQFDEKNLDHLRVAVDPSGSFEKFMLDLTYHNNGEDKLHPSTITSYLFAILRSSVDKSSTKEEIAAEVKYVKTYPRNFKMENGVWSNIARAALGALYEYKTKVDRMDLAYSRVKVL